MATVHRHPSAPSKDKPVYWRHRLLKDSTNPSGRHFQAMVGTQSNMIVFFRFVFIAQETVRTPRFAEPRARAKPAAYYLAGGSFGPPEGTVPARTTRRAASPAHDRECREKYRLIIRGTTPQSGGFFRESFLSVWKCDWLRGRIEPSSSGVMSFPVPPLPTGPGPVFQDYQGPFWVDLGTARAFRKTAGTP